MAHSLSVGVGAKQVIQAASAMLFTADKTDPVLRGPLPPGTDRAR
jgi:hypothetical protein